MDQRQHREDQLAQVAGARTAGDHGIADNPELSPNGRKRKRQRKSLDESITGTARLARKIGERIGEEHDPEDLAIFLDSIESAVRYAKDAAIKGLRRQGRSASEIARPLGWSRQYVNREWPAGGADDVG